MYLPLHQHLPLSTENKNSLTQVEKEGGRERREGGRGGRGGRERREGEEGGKGRRERREGEEGG